MGDRGMVATWCVCVFLGYLATVSAADRKWQENNVEKPTTKQALLYDKYAKYTDCHKRWLAGERQSGVYTIYPNYTYPIQVYCNHTDDNSFTVIQRRMYGNVDFVQNMYTYQVGFGNPQGDYWAGLETIYHLTTIGKQNQLRIDLQDWSGVKLYFLYPHFSINSAQDRYRLSIRSSGTPTAIGDDMLKHNNCQFGTYDSPDYYQCANQQGAGWWYNYCAYALLNGRYYPNGPYKPAHGYYDGTYWEAWRGYGYSLKFVSMSLYN